MIMIFFNDAYDHDIYDNIGRYVSRLYLVVHV